VGGQPPSLPLVCGLFIRTFLLVATIATKGMLGPQPLAESRVVGSLFKGVYSREGDLPLLRLSLHDFFKSFVLSVQWVSFPL
jgi:hypothetical protein